MADDSPPIIAPGGYIKLTVEEQSKVKDMWLKIAAATERIAEEDKAEIAAKVEPKKSSFWGSSAVVAKEAHFSPERLRQSLWEAVKIDEPDSLILRYLRARKWDVDAAFEMMIKSLRWRIEDMHLDDDIMYNGEEHELKRSQSDDPAEKREGESFMHQLRTGKAITHNKDIGGRPMSFVRARLHFPKDQTVKSLERYTVFNIETTRLMIEPPIDTGTLVFDLTGFGLGNMDYTPVKFIVTCFEANFPESLAAIIVYNAPWVFWGVWSVIRGWLDPVVAAKVSFVKGPTELSKFVEKNKIMSELGGDEEYEWKYIEPVEGENKLMQDTEAKEKLQKEREELYTRFEQVTKEWVKGEDTVAERLDIARQLKINYCRLDPYIRARCFYDRIGMIDLDAMAKRTEEERSAVTAKA